MTSRISRIGLIAIFPCVLTCTIVGADRFQITTRSDHPISELCQALESQFHWRISYEDAPIFSQDDVQPGNAPNGVPWLVVRDASATVDVPLPAGMSAELKGKTLQGILDGHRLSGGRAGFRVTQNGDLVHVVGTSVRGQSGKIEPFEPLLDTKISFTRGNYDLGTLVQTVLGQVSQIRGIPIVLATVPTNLFIQSRVTEEASNEVARDVLIRAFEEINGTRFAQFGQFADPVRLTWYMVYNPNGGTYFFNVHNVAPDLQSDGSKPVSPPVSTRRGSK